MGDIWTYIPYFLRGFPFTIGIALSGLALALLVGGAVGTLTSATQNSAGVSIWNRGARAVGGIYVEFFRGTSEVVQLFWVFFALPVLLSIDVSPILAAIVVLGLNQGAYVAEIVRGAMNSIDPGQREACIALNLPVRHRFQYVLVPQGIARMLPGLANSAVDIVKATSVVSLITVSDLTYRALTIRQATGASAEVFALNLVAYLAITSVITVIFKNLERRVPRGLRATSGRRSP